MTRLELAIIKSPPIRFISGIAKRIVLPGFEGLSLNEVGRFFFKEIRSIKISERCAAITYNFVMAIPPSLLFLCALVPYLPLKNVEHTILSMLRLVTPSQALYKSISGVIMNFMHTEQRQVLSFGILLTMFYSSNGMMALMRNFDRSQHVYVKRSAFMRRWTAIKLTVLLYGVILAALIVFIMLQAKFVNKILAKIFFSAILIKTISILLMIGMLLCAISIIYKYGPSLSQRFKFISPGSVFATILCVLGTLIFYYLVNNFINYNKVYGSIGTLIAFMVWIWLNTMVILIGYELNVSILLGKISRGANAPKDNKKI